MILKDKINEILTANHEEVFNNISFTESLKNSSLFFRRLMKNSFENDSWIDFIHFEIMLAMTAKVKFSTSDLLTFDFIKTAVFLTDKDKYYNLFD